MPKNEGQKSQFKNNVGGTKTEPPGSNQHGKCSTGTKTEPVKPQKEHPPIRVAALGVFGGNPGNKQYQNLLR